MAAASVRSGTRSTTSVVLLACVIAVGCRIAQTQPVPFADLLDRWDGLPDDQRHAAIGRYLEQHGSPVVRDGHVLFVAEGDAVALHGDFNAWGELPDSAAMLRIGQTRWLYRIERFTADARIEYCFAAGDECNPDPHNRRRVATFGREMAELRMPAFRAPPMQSGPLVAGRLATFVHDSASLGNQRLVTVYVPTAADTTSGLPIVYFGDGQQYIDDIKAPEILDSLIRSGAVPPAFAVFVPPVSRSSEYRGNEAHRRMLAFEIVPYVQARFSPGSSREKRYLVGSSRGALMALDLVTAYPDVFGNVALISPAIRSSDVLGRIAAPPAPTRVVIAEGEYDLAWAADAVAVRDRLRAMGYETTHRVYPDGHSPTAWRHVLHWLLPALLSSR